MSLKASSHVMYHYSTTGHTDLLSMYLLFRQYVYVYILYMYTSVNYVYLFLMQ